MKVHTWERLKKAQAKRQISGRGKKPPVIMWILCVLLLTGCSAAGDLILQQTGVITEEEYEKYLELRDAGQLDDNGRYTAEELKAEPTFEPPAGSVHVTFAENTYMTIRYYLDEEHETPVNPQLCYLKPGEKLYASEPECHHPTSSWYSFDRFRVYAQEADGTRGEELPWASESGIVMQVPENCTTTEVSVIPMGKYEKRRLELSDYYTDTVDREQKPSGTWIVNDKEVTAKVLSVSPVEPLIVDYKYDPEKYDFVSSDPYSFYHENGLVRFETTYATEDIERYTVELRPLEGRFLFDPENYTSENGTIIFKYAGREITEPEYIPDGRTIEYTATPASGYDGAAKTGKITVNTSDPEKTEAELQKLTNFYIKRQVKVTLPQPEAGGTIAYLVNGKPLTGNSVLLPSGTEIRMKFRNWNGWTRNAKVMGEVTYTVTDQKEGQTVSLEGADIRTEVFTEAEKHKPELKVILTDSVKGAYKFDIKAAGTGPQTGLDYTAGNKTTIIPDFLGQRDRVIYSGKTGTYPGIRLTIKDDTILTGYAIKLETVMKDTRGSESRTIKYIKELPTEEEIKLYDSATVSTDAKVYEKVTVKVSETEVKAYQEKTLENAEIRAVLNDITTPYTLKEGDLLEPSRKIEITVTPEAGYYVTGGKGADGSYRETMKYSKWEKDSQKILNRHPIRKICHITLNGADSYGTCVYKLDGAAVTGEIEVREGQKLTLEYTLTDGNRKIVRTGAAGFISGLINGETERCTIPVTEAMDGRTIQRSDYIKVE